jgi:hypothetical protein
MLLLYSWPDSPHARPRTRACIVSELPDRISHDAHVVTQIHTTLSAYITYVPRQARGRDVTASSVSADTAAVTMEQKVPPTA